MCRQNKYIILLSPFIVAIIILLFSSFVTVLLFSILFVYIGISELLLVFRERISNCYFFFFIFSFTFLIALEYQFLTTHLNDPLFCFEQTEHQMEYLSVFNAYGDGFQINSQSKPKPRYSLIFFGLLLITKKDSRNKNQKKKIHIVNYLFTLMSLTKKKLQELFTQTRS